MKPQAQVGVQRARLIYVVGPSGAGKDSVISYARRVLGDGADYVFPRRHITRPPDGGSENHEAITQDAFDRQCRDGQFALHWSANGLCYGIGSEINAWMQAGQHVVINGSRAYLPEAARLYPHLVPVLITIDPAVLRGRLMARGREDADQIEDRLRRAAELGRINHPALRTIANNGALAEAGEALVALLRSL
jgi:ribose 1,5-bisphosphokinase